MNSDKLVISKYYTFEIEGGDASSDDMPDSVCTLICLTHEKVMQMGQFFGEEDPYSVDAFTKLWQLTPSFATISQPISQKPLT